MNFITSSFLCRSLDLFGAEPVAIDGSKFNAENFRNLTRGLSLHP
jgi:hypothetical protein